MSLGKKIIGKTAKHSANGKECETQDLVYWLSKSSYLTKKGDQLNFFTELTELNKNIVTKYLSK